MNTITERLLERHRVDSERMWPAPSDLDLLAAAQIKELEGALRDCLKNMGWSNYTDDEMRTEATLGNGLAPIILRARAALQPKEPK